MSDYKRITRRNEDGTTWVKCVCCENVATCDYTKESCCQVLQDRLAELEDKIENGTLIELPYLHHHKENINGLNYEVWQVVFKYKGIMLTTKVIYDKAEAEAELARIRGQK